MREPKNWTEAQQTCAQYKLSLPTIFFAYHNAMINTEVRKYLNATVGWWIGQWQCLGEAGSGLTNA
jgi:hypothetical protein